MEVNHIQKTMFLLLFLGLAILLLIIFSPFFTTILWSLLFFIIINPLYQFCLCWISQSSKIYRAYQNVLAALFSLLLVIVIVVPIIFIFYYAFKQSLQLIQLLENFIKKSAGGLVFHSDDPWVLTVKELTFNSVDLSQIDIPRFIISILRNSSDVLLRLSTTILQNLADLILTIAFMVFTIFFLLVDGKYLLSLFMRAVPLDTELLKRFIQQFKDTTRHLITGYFLVAFYQGAAAGLIFYLFHIPGFLLLSLLTFFFSFLPIVGTAGIWIPVVVLKLLSGAIQPALLLSLLCAIFISGLDNILRPLILKGMIKIHPLLVFFSILGGVQFLGFKGLFLGPMIVIFFFAALEVFLDQYHVHSAEEAKRS
jgi:predicted PurR-regulated permease PerM